MNPVLDEILQSGFVKTAQGEPTQLHSHVSAEEGKLLYEIVQEVKPTVSLELGLAFGVSALFICEALAACGARRHIIIDPDQHDDRWKSVGLSNLKRAGYEHLVEFHNLSSHLVLPQLEASGAKIDFAFVDGMHTFDHVLLDFFYIDRMLRVGGVVAFDDASFPSIRKVCRFVVINRSYSVFRALRPEIRRTPSLKGNAVRYLARKSEMVRRLLSPEFFDPDFDLGLVVNSRCIAFKKEAEDTRSWDFHKEF